MSSRITKLGYRLGLDSYGSGYWIDWVTFVLTYSYDKTLYFVTTEAFWSDSIRVWGLHVFMSRRIGNWQPFWLLVQPHIRHIVLCAPNTFLKVFHLGWSLITSNCMWHVWICSFLCPCEREEKLHSGVTKHEFQTPWNKFAIVRWWSFVNVWQRSEPLHMTNETDWRID